MGVINLEKFIDDLIRNRNINFARFSMIVNQISDMFVTFAASSSSISSAIGAIEALAP